jgi:hypothetical protein
VALVEEGRICRTVRRGARRRWRKRRMRVRVGMRERKRRRLPLEVEVGESFKGLEVCRLLMTRKERRRRRRGRRKRGGAGEVNIDTVCIIIIFYLPFLP